MVGQSAALGPHRAARGAAVAAGPTGEGGYALAAVGLLAAVLLVGGWWILPRFETRKPGPTAPPRAAREAERPAPVAAPLPLALPAPRAEAVAPRPAPEPPPEPVGAEDPWITIPAGDAWIGGERTTVSAFAITRREVTVAQYRACEGCVAPGCALPGEDHPVACVTWRDAMGYCAAIGRRLPTAREWEKAARGGCERYADCEKQAPLYPWGNGAPSCEVAVIFEHGLGSGCGMKRTQPVGYRSRGRSPYGVDDMAGNVSEWVADPDSEGWRAVRGSSFDTLLADYHQASHADSKDESASEPTLGFRCAGDVQ